MGCELTKLDLETVTTICREYRIVSADITLYEDATDDQLIDVIEGNRWAACARAGGKAGS